MNIKKSDTELSEFEKSWGLPPGEPEQTAGEGDEDDNPAGDDEADDGDGDDDVDGDGDEAKDLDDGDEPEVRDVPQTLEELKAMNLDEEAMASLVEHFGGELPEHLREDGDPAGGGEGSEGGNGGDGLMEFKPEDLKRLPKWAQKVVESQQKALQAVKPYLDEQYRQGQEEILQDPIVQQRLAFLRSGATQDVSQVDDLVSEESLKGLVLDMRLDRTRTLASIKKVAAEGYRRGMEAQRQMGEAHAKETELKLAYKRELDQVVASDPSLKGKDDAPYEKVQDFIKWVQDEGAVDLVKVGGKLAYEMFLVKTGKSQNLLRKVQQGAKPQVKPKGATTFTREVKGHRTKPTSHGVDIERFRKDRTYQDAVWNKHEHDPKMRSLMEEWAG